MIEARNYQIPEEERIDQDNLRPQGPTRELGLFSNIQGSLISYASWAAESCKAALEKRTILYLANHLIKANTPEKEREEIEAAIAAIPENERREVCGIAVYFAPQCKGQLKELLEFIASMPAQSRNRQCSKLLAALKLALEERKERDFPTDELVDVLKKAIYLAPNFNPKALSSLIREIALIAKDDKDVFAKAGFFLSLIPENRYVTNPASILSVIARIPIEEREDILTKFSLLYNNMKGLKIEQALDLLDILNKISKDELLSTISIFIDPAYGLYLPMDPTTKIKLFSKIALRTKQEQEDIFIKINFLNNYIPYSEVLGRVNRFDILDRFDIIDKLSKEEWENIVNRTSYFLDENTLSFNSSAAKLTFKLAEKAHEEREDIFIKMDFIIRKIRLFDTKELVQIIDILSETPKEELLDVIEKFSFLLNGRLDLTSMNLPYHIRLLSHSFMIFFCHLAQLSKEQRLQHLERIEQQLLEEDNQIHWKSYILHLIKAIQTPLNQPIPQIAGNMARAAARGQVNIDVHDGKREPKTLEALQLLRQHQEEINLEKTWEAAEGFLAYLTKEKNRTSDVHLKQQMEAASFVLEAPKTDVDPWGPLLTQPSLDPNESNLYHVGKEAIGRLWLYVQKISDPKDQKNALTSVLTALNESIATNGSRVCNPGKIERLFIAVLQGRLKGVKIDDSISLGENLGPSKKLTEQSLTIFFANEAHQKIDNRKDLLEAGRLFCENSPNLNRMGFLKLLDDYMALEPETFQFIEN
ncbi:MAG: hypothetical protein Q8L98_02785 [Chlamydiales bacterium]|nr:hypothetical protein [Chlamydiales bacterium]